MQDGSHVYEKLSGGQGAAVSLKRARFFHQGAVEVKSWRVRRVTSKEILGPFHGQTRSHCGAPLTAQTGPPRDTYTHSAAVPFCSTFPTRTRTDITQHTLRTTIDVKQSRGPHSIARSQRSTSVRPVHSHQSHRLR